MGALTIAEGMRHGEVSVVAPFRYMRLPIGLLFAVFLFSEPLRVNMIVGSAMIVLSGIFIFWRERRA